jgi:starch synthase
VVLALTREMKPIVLHVAAEVSPFHKSGGLGDVLAGLPPALDGEGVDVRVITPRYGEASKFKSIGGEENLTPWPVPLQIALGGRTHEVSVYEARTHRGRATTYFIEADHLSRGQLYGYGDDAYRFAIFGKAAVAVASVLARSKNTGRVSILHAHDWHAALAVYYAKALASSVHGIPCVFTIHNLAFQGQERASTAQYLDIGWDAFHDIFEDRGTLNLMKGALLACDRITTVSPTYAHEIRTARYGHGMDGLLRWLSGKLRGITNGIDTSVWDPRADKHLAATFDDQDLAGKEACRSALRFELGLRQSDAPILGCVSRLTAQKGIDHLCDVADDFVRNGGQIAVLGEGEEPVEHRLHWLQMSHPGSIAFRKAFDEGLAHRIYAGSDLFAMPSRFEPCGLAQMYSMRYGTIPVARATGGLVDTIAPLHNKHDVGGATGILYASDDSAGLRGALRWGLDVARDAGALHALRINGMREDFSWEKSARTYVELYRELGL